MAEDFAVMSQAFKSTTGMQDYTSTDLSSQTGVAAIYLNGYGTVLDTSVSSQIVAHGQLNIGFQGSTTNGTLQVSTLEDAQANQDAAHRRVNTRVIYRVSPGNVASVSDFASENNFVTDGSKIQVDGTASPDELIVAGLFAGSHWSTAGGTVSIGTTSQNSIILGPDTVTGLSFQPEAVLITYTGLASTTSATEARTGFGWAVDNGGIKQRAHATFANDNTAAGETDGIIETDRIGTMIDGTGVVRSIELTAFNSDGFDITQRDAVGASGTFHWFALASTSFEFDAGTFDVPTSGSQNVSTLVDPEGLIQVLTHLTAVDSHTSGAAAGSMSICLTDLGDDHRCITWSNEEGVATTNVKQTVSDYTVVLADDGTKDIEGLTTLGTGQFTIAPTNFPASLTKNIFLAFGQAAATGNPLRRRR